MNSMSGRKRISTNGDRRVHRIYKCNKNQTDEELGKEWHIDACPNTIRNKLKKQGTKSYSTTKKAQLYSRIIQKRLEFCEKYEGWTVDDWETVVFSDETNIRVEPTGGHRRVWRKAF